MKTIKVGSSGRVSDVNRVPHAEADNAENERLMLMVFMMMLPKAPCTFIVCSRYLRLKRGPYIGTFKA